MVESLSDVKDSKAIFEKLEAMEATLDLSRFRVGEVDVWPLIRFQFVMRINQYLKGAGTVRVGFVSRIARKARLLPDAAKQWSRQIFDFGSGSGGLERCDILILTDASSRRVKVDSKWYDVFMDPIIDHYSSEGVSHLTVECNHNFIDREPSFRSSFHISHIQFWLFLRSMIIRQSVSTSHDFEDAYKALVESAERLGVAEYIMSSSAIRREAAFISLLSDYFDRLLKRIQPRAVFMAPYNSYPGRALCISSKRANIPVFDVQHGAQGHYHPAYRFCENIPNGGFNTVPNYFLTWSDDDSTSINSWGKATSSAEGITLGNLFMAKYLGNSDLAIESDAEYEKAFGELSDKVHVLLTLQWGAFLPEVFERLLTSSLDGYFFLIRFHPSTSISERNAVRQKLASLALNHFDLDNATALPIYTLLRNIDVHITQSSSTVIEASAFDVPSIITGPIGKAYYRKLVEQGRAFQASEPEQVLDHLVRLGKNATGERLSRNLTMQASEVLNTVIGVRD